MLSSKCFCGRTNYMDTAYCTDCGRKVVSPVRTESTIVSTHRGYTIEKTGPTSFKAAGAMHGSAWSAICYIDELLSP